MLHFFCGIVPRSYQDCSRVLEISHPKLATKPTESGAEPKGLEENAMNKLLAVMMVAVLPALALGSDDADSVAPARTLKPVVSVIELTPEQVQLLEKVHGDYQARKATLDAEYKAQVEALISEQAAGGNS